ncbi:hypothetical protein CFP56_036646 [Quercus suber]|uniref:Uncharacterized protein n=1 Tax=Quercus suber TaxID=58331 RepID=A0AAW0J7Q1_QUESU
MAKLIKLLPSRSLTLKWRFINVDLAGFKIHSMFLLDHSSSAIVFIEGTVDFIFDKATTSKPSQVNVLTVNGSSVMTNDRSENHKGIVIHKSLIGATPTDKLWLENLVNSTYLGRP